MPTYPISNGEIAPGKPLTGWLLRRLRDNWAEDLCDPPGSQTPNLRPTCYRVMKSHRTVGSPVVVSDSTYVGQVSNIRTEVILYAGTGKSAGCILGFIMVGADLRVARLTPLISSQDTLAGGLFDNTWLDIATNNTWVPMFTWTSGADNPTLEIRANLVGTATTVEFRFTGSLGALVCRSFTVGKLFSIQDSTT